MNLNLNETTGIPTTYDYLNNFASSGVMANPSMVVILFIMVVVYALIFMYLGRIEISANQS